jgi:hypothetical protein
MQANSKQHFNILIFGASYGSLLASKLALAGHNATLVCLPAEVELINSVGTRVRLPIKAREALVEIDSRNLPGRINAATPQNVNTANFDLVVLAMQEPQYGATTVSDLLETVAVQQIPTMSIMNMPPLPYLHRIPGLNANDYLDCYTAPEVWDKFDPRFMTLCSPDAQAFRPPEEGVNVLQVRLPTNFKAARFESEEHTNMLRKIAADIEAVRFNVDGEKIELPVKLKVFESVFVPLAKWSMLMTGNYRCITPEGMRPIKEAVHSDMKTSQVTYDWVRDLCISLGADLNDLVPFEKYAAAANGLANPSSAARALYGGAKNIERVDKLVQSIAKHKGKNLSIIDDVVTLVNTQLEKNRAQ